MIKKILLFGGNGMVGKNIINHEKKIRDPNDPRNDYNIFAPNSKQCNLLDETRVENHIRFFEPDLIIHAAGKVGGIHANIQKPYEFLYENSAMGMNIINAAKKLNVSKIINIGSSCMYPKNASNPLKEESILSGEFESTNEGYALAKSLVLKLCQTASDNNKKYKTIIPCNLYGKWDKFDLNNSHMVPSAIKKIHEAKLNNAPINIWGDGNSRREFMFSSDLADFIYFAISKFDDIPEITNVGMGHDYSITEYYNTIKKILDCNSDLEYDTTKPNGVKSKLLNIQKQSNLGWAPKTTLEDGIKQTYNFFLENCI